MSELAECCKKAVRAVIEFREATHRYGVISRQYDLQYPENINVLTCRKGHRLEKPLFSPYFEVKQ